MNNTLFVIFFYFLSTFAYATSFDCQKAVSLIEKAICTDKILGDLDDSLQQSYQKALEHSQDAAALKTSQLEWLKNVRNQCADNRCVKEAYTARLQVFDKQGTTTAPSLKAGEYLTEGGWGYLKISDDKKTSAHFAIEAMGGNGHSCSLAGVSHNGQAIPAGQEENEVKCVVKFDVKSNGIEVTSNESDACSFYCGARAMFEGFYLNVAKQCIPSVLTKTKHKFKQLYDQKDYTAAYAILQPMFEDCKKTINDLDQQWLRNDLALTAYKLENMAMCQAWLEPLLDTSRKSDDVLKEAYAPTDYDNIMPVIKATRTNAKLCGIH
jgi:uncharacterized protein